MRPWAWAAAAGLVCALAGGCGDESVITPGGGPSAPPSSSSAVDGSLAQACLAAGLTPLKGSAAPDHIVRQDEERARLDADDLARTLLDQPDVQSVGVARCSEPVVVVGVSAETDVVPPSGPRGTPVLVLRMGPFFAS